MCTAKQLFCCLVICVTVIIEISAQNVSGSSISNGLSAVSNPVSVLSTTTRKPLLQSFRLPCSCFQGQCGCCTGYILDRLNQKACLNMTYEPEDFAVSAVMSLNGVPFYKNSISGKNPPPMCFRLPRLRFITLCLEFSNVYFLNRNVHLCVDAEANWADFTLLEWSFDCIRMGLSGVQIVNREDGGGLPEKPIDIEDQTDEDYDDSARNNPNEKLLNYGEKPKIVFHHSLQRLEGKSPDRRLISVKRVSGERYIIHSLR
ncbi:hypothetical protein GWI33_019973 [Rhynchophorus ferrugineus]|uniref:DUF4773 domain-containing protein n=1 Tax=Rhynchophorus ferrugineus TaxID=354439 RepID=A0A834HRL8_RHYFE|nr:hypothetical protein GWI33_019973 [Rhynchophorus ferrugineus]